jgi:hypothetical protein
LNIILFIYWKARFRKKRIGFIGCNIPHQREETPTETQWQAFSPMFSGINQHHFTFRAVLPGDRAP